MNHSYANSFINFLIAVFAGIPLLALYWIWQRNAQTPLEYFTPLAILFYSLVVIFFSAFLWSRESKIRLLLVTFSISISVYAVEAVLSLGNFKSPLNTKVYRERKAVKQNIPFDDRTKYDVVSALQVKDHNTWPNIGPQYFVATEGLRSKDQKTLFPVGGISSAHVIVCNEDGHFSSYQSDEHGFNNPKGLYTPGNVDILLIGDSFTHGACVDEGKDIASHMRKMGFPRTITLGSNGIGPLIELATLTEYGTILKPKKVIWLYYEGNDLADLHIESTSEFLLNYLNDSFLQNLYSIQTEINQSLMAYVNANANSLSAQYQAQSSANSIISIFKLRNIRTQLMLNQEKPVANASTKGLFEAILATAKRRVNAWGGEILFVYLPEYSRFRTKDIHAFNQSRQKQEVLSLMERLDIKTIDLTTSFNNQPHPTAFFPLEIEGHYTEEGYKLVAKEISGALAFAV